MSWTVAIGIDTHKDAHTAVACDRLGAMLDSRSFAATAAGYLALLEWAQSLGRPAFAIEGAGSYGAGLARFLAGCALEVFECERPRRSERRRGKSDLIDATLAARRLLAGEPLAHLRGGGVREDLRLLLLERRGAERARSAALNQLHAVVLTAPERLRERLGCLAGSALARAAMRVRVSVGESAVAVAVLRRLGGRALALESELTELNRELEAIVERLCPQLLAECGVGSFGAAQLLVSSGDPSRMRSEAAFAALAGTSPVDASSGRQQRHRLNRGGDRQLNRALHVIALCRIVNDPRTAAYYQRLLASGKSKREALRCVKRALARYLYGLLRRIPLTTLTT